MRRIALVLAAGLLVTRNARRGLPILRKCWPRTATEAGALGRSAAEVAGWGPVPGRDGGGQAAEAAPRRARRGRHPGDQGALPAGAARARRPRRDDPAQKGRGRRVVRAGGVRPGDPRPAVLAEAPGLHDRSRGVRRSREAQARPSDPGEGSRAGRSPSGRRRAYLCEERTSPPAGSTAPPRRPAPPHHLRRGLRRREGALRRQRPRVRHPGALEPPGADRFRPGLRRPPAVAPSAIVTTTEVALAPVAGRRRPDADARGEVPTRTVPSQLPETTTGRPLSSVVARALTRSVCPR